MNLYSVLLIRKPFHNRKTVKCQKINIGIETFNASIKFAGPKLYFNIFNYYLSVILI